MRSGAAVIARGNRSNRYNVGLSGVRLAQRTYCGTVYHSALEARYAHRLDLLIQAGKVKSWTRQIPFTLYSGRPEGKHEIVCKLVIDFRVIMANGAVELVECKGFATDTWKLKEKMFRACYPELRLNVVDRV